MPVLVDGDRTPSNPIVVEYLALHHPGPERLIPADPDAALEVRRLDRIFDNYVMTPMQKIVGDRLRPEDWRDPHGLEEARRLLDTSYAWLERELAGRTWPRARISASPTAPRRRRFIMPTGFRPAAASRWSRPIWSGSGNGRASRARQEAEPYAHLFPT